MLAPNRVDVVQDRFSGAWGALDRVSQLFVGAGSRVRMAQNMETAVWLAVSRLPDIFMVPSTHFPIGFRAFSPSRVADKAVNRDCAASALRSAGMRCLKLTVTWSDYPPWSSHHTNLFFLRLRTTPRFPIAEFRNGCSQGRLYHCAGKCKRHIFHSALRSCKKKSLEVGVIPLLHD